MKELFRKLAGVLALLCALQALAPVLAMPAHAAEPPQDAITYYTDVPGITQEEIDAIEAVRSRTTFLTYGMTMSTECYREEKTTQGFAALFSAWLSSFFGIKVSPIIYEWDVLLAGLEDHTIAFSGEVSFELRGEEDYYMTMPIAERRVKYVSFEGANRLEILGRSRDLKYGFLEGTTTEALVAPYLGENVVPVPVKNYNDAYQKLLLKEIDALFMDETMEGIYARYDRLIIEDFLPLSYNRVSMATKDASLAPFIRVVEKYVENAGSYRFSQMYEDGSAAYLRYYLTTRLSVEEAQYLKNAIDAERAIQVAIDPDNYPVSFYNQREKQWQGIAVSILENLARTTGLQFQYANETDGAWSAALQGARDGDYEMVAGVIRTAALERDLLFPVLGYQDDNYAFISASGLQDITLSDIPYLHTGLIQNTAYSDIFYELVPNHGNITAFATKQEALDALHRGDVDVLMGTRNLLLDMTNYMEITGYRDNLVLHRPYVVSFAFPPSQTVLNSILSKALELVDTEVIVDSWTRRVFDYSSTVVKAQRPFLMGAAFFMLVAMALLGIMLLRNRQMAGQLEKTVKLRTQELEIQTDAAKVASQAKGEFLARMSHEIRTPLNAIIGMTTIARKTDDIAKVHSSLEEIVAASEHLVGILNDVLDMSKIESGKFILVDDPFVLCRAMDEVSNIILQRTKEKNITFTTQCTGIEACAVLGDKLRLKQVLINLLGNAVKFTPVDGRITLEVKLLAQTEQTLTVYFAVTDSGIGIAQDKIDHLFQAFEQADSSIAVRFGGTGLGLSISQSLIQQMHGEITVTSELGVGSTFQFTLALPRVAFEEETPQSEAELRQYTGKRILLVEDIAINRYILKELLEPLALEIDEAADGLEAVAHFSQMPEGSYQLIFMDVQMPNMDGYEATRQIRALNRPDAATVPIIAMTANAYREDVERALSAGMNAHLAKPIDINQVVEMIGKWM